MENRLHRHLRRLLHTSSYHLQLMIYTVTLLLCILLRLCFHVHYHYNRNNGYQDEIDNQLREEVHFVIAGNRRSNDNFTLQVILPTRFDDGENE